MIRSMILTAVCALAIPFAAHAAPPAPATAEHQQSGEHKGMKHEGDGCACCKKMAADKAKQGVKASDSAEHAELAY